MSNYSQVTSFGPKDNLASGNASKKILGAEIDAELSGISTAISSKLNSSAVVTEIPTGTRMLFVQSATPTGWTLSGSGWDDRAVVIDNSAGGSTGGSWTITGLTVANHTHNDNFAVSNATGDTVTIQDGSLGGGGPVTTFYGTGALGGNATIDFNFSGNVGSGGSGNVSSTGSWRPQYAQVLACTKNA